MLINIEEIREYIEIGSIYRLAKETDLNESLLYQYRRGEKNVENMSLKIAAEIQKYINKEKKMIKMYRVIKHEEEYNKNGFEYEEFMNIQKDGDQFPEEVARFKTIEEAEKEISKYNSEIREVGNKVLVTEYYIEFSEIDEDDFNSDDFDYLQGPDYDNLAPLED